jgi:HK97 family phage portal protein
MGREAGKTEERGSLESPSQGFTPAAVIAALGVTPSASGVPVSIESALGVPAVWSAVNFMAGELAQLPLNVFKRTSNGNEKAGGPLQNILHDAVNDETTSFQWRKHVWEQVFTEGRSFTYIEWNGANKVANLWPMESKNVKVVRKNQKRVYQYKLEGKTISYGADEVLDIAFMLTPDMLGHRSPIMSNKDTIGLAIAATQYGSKFFANGGVPPFVLTGPMNSPAAIKRASDDLEAAVRMNAKDPRLALTLPAGHDLKSIGADPEKSQLVETQRFIIEQVARIYSLPPVFLQDLSHGTFANTEQQDLFFVKHSLTRWAEQFEQELNLKLFGRTSNQYVEMNLDGLLRGDFKTRMEGYAQGIQNGVLMPNEARRRENLPDDAEGNKLMIQGATVPLGSSVPMKPATPNGGANNAAP